MPEPPSYAVRTGRGTSAPVLSPSPPQAPGGSTATPSAGTGRRRARPGGPREGARHGRSSGRESAADSVVRQRLLRLATVPAVLVALIAAAVIAYVLGSQDGGSGTSGGGTDSAAVWGVLGGALLVVVAIVVGAGLIASGEARTAVERYTALRRGAAQHQAELRSLLRRLERGERIQPPEPANPAERPSGDALDLLAHELGQVQRSAEVAVIEAASLVRTNSASNDEKVEVFVNLARRLQSLVHREIELLDELENDVEDPDLLKGLFHVDHLATRIRRHAENLAVLGGAVSRRQWSRPVTMTEVLRSSIAEVEQYPRIKLVPPIEGTLRGHAVADVIHLLAELVENASVFSAPQTQVLLRAQHVTAGLAVEVEDRGLGMTAEEQSRMNAVLADPEQIDVGQLLQDGRIGLFVVSALARRHGIVVQLQSNIYGGTQAVLVLPRALLGDESASEGAEPTAGQVPAPPRRPEPTLPTPEAVPVPHQPRPATASTPNPAPLPQRPAPAAPSGVAGRSQQPTGAHRYPDSPAERAFPDRPSTERPHPEGRPGGHIGGEHPDPLSPGGMPRTSGRPTGGPPAGGPPSGERPQLPRRRRQEHLAPELREAPRSHESSHEPETGHDPGLMAAFRRGTSLAEEPDDSSR